MLSQIYGIPRKENTQPWDLGTDLGSGFEVYIYQVLCAALSSYFTHGTVIYQTPSSRDDGKDIIIESPVAIDIMGFTFPLRGKKLIKIYIECKSSNSSTISFNQFAGNLQRIKGDGISYYVLITNTTIAPYSFYQFSNELKEIDVTFYLLDQRLLHGFLTKMKTEIGSYVKLEDEIPSNVEYQVLSSFHDGKPTFDLFLLLRNYENKAINVCLKINTDRNWEISQNTIDTVLAPYEAYCVKLFIQKEYYDGLNELLLTVNVQGNDLLTEIKGLHVECNFIPPLCGKAHHAAIDRITSHILSSDHYSFFYLWGKAGVGKSRIIDEILARLQGRGVETACFRCTKEDGLLERRIGRFLVDRRFLHSQAQSLPLSDMLVNVNATFQKCFIVIDDLHNASNSLLDELKKTAQIHLSQPITLLVLGRNDYSAGGLDYYSLVQWCVDTLPKQGIVLPELDDEDAKNLIRLIIQDIPNFALEKIYHLSNCNPLFIVQTIEYLLDLKLVQIINRSSVGIPNPESFASKLYIPKKIEEIYMKRFQALQKIPSGETLCEFLLVCSFLGIKFESSVATAYFDTPEEATKELFSRGFLKIGADGECSFVHESLYLFLKNLVASSAKLRKRSASRLCKNWRIFNKLNPLQKGRATLWSGQPAKARAYFLPAIKEISKMENHSNINIDRGYYEYLEDIFRVVSSSELKEKIILCKIYIALHYYTPFIAIQQCQWARAQTKKCAGLRERTDLEWMLKEHEAHSLLNASQLKRADAVLQELLSATIYEPNCMDAQTRFDLYDKLSNLYIKYNSGAIAKRYILLATQLAQGIKDRKLEALAYISHAKLYLYSNLPIAKHYIQKADECLENSQAYRIKIHNDITRLIVSLMEEGTSKLNDWLTEAKQILNACIENQFANSIIRVNLLLGAFYYLKGTSVDFGLCIRYLKQGIDASLQFGIGTYIWEIYTLLALSAIREGQPESNQARLFNTVYQQLKRQNLLYIGSEDFCYGNLLALSNIAKFCAVHEFETQFYQKIGAISHIEYTEPCDYNCPKGQCSYVCGQSTERLKKELQRFQRASKGRPPILYHRELPKASVWDETTGYYIILS